MVNVRVTLSSFQYAVARHLSNRLQRGLVFCEETGLWGSRRGGGDEDEVESASQPRTVVVSGGVACNQAIRRAMAKVQIQRIIHR